MPCAGGAKRFSGRATLHLRVLCGDAIGVDVLREIPVDCPFSLWGFSPVSLPGADRPPDSVLATNAQVSAEIVSALVYCLDGPSREVPNADALADALAALRLSARDRAAFGRSLAFAPTGERQGSDLGHVLMSPPGGQTVFAIERLEGGRWSARCRYRRPRLRTGHSLVGPSPRPLCGPVRRRCARARGRATLILSFVLV